MVSIPTRNRQNDFGNILCIWVLGPLGEYGGRPSLGASEPAKKRKGSSNHDFRNPPRLVPTSGQDKKPNKNRVLGPSGSSFTFKACA